MVLGAVGDTPIRVAEAEILKNSKIPSHDVFLRVADKASETVRRSIPHRASLPYKEKAVKGVVLDLLYEVFGG